LPFVAAPQSCSGDFEGFADFFRRKNQESHQCESAKSAARKLNLLVNQV
jgi:hypothetical protein